MKKNHILKAIGWGPKESPGFNVSLEPCNTPPRYSVQLNDLYLSLQEAVADGEKVANLLGLTIVGEQYTDDTDEEGDAEE